MLLSLIGALERLNRWRKASASRAKLRALSPAELEDIGIRPGEIAAFLRGEQGRRPSRPGPRPVPACCPAP